MDANAVVIDASDNVATVLAELAPGTPVHQRGPGPAVSTTEQIPVGHKVALSDIAVGEPILKYGHTIGVASQPIHVGEHVHTHNLTGQEV